MQGLSKTGRSDVPEVLVFEILHRLPVKSLIRFRCVFLGPCNGILCLHDVDDKVALWNPSTREFKILPQSSIQCPPSANIDFGCSGFGYDSQTDDYKVVRFAAIYFGGHDEHYNGYVEFDRNEKVELYSLRSDSWKEISYPEVTAYDPLLFNTYVNGFSYWRALGHYDYAILSFDMEGTEKSFDLWVVNGSWTKQFTIDSVPGVERVLGFWKNGELFLESSDHELVLFDPSTRELKNLGIHAYMGTMHISAYVENLVPINGRSEYEEHIIRRLPGGASN
ncbi:hypothetical protein V6N13_107259 [Hibiscus sabdariffa]